MTTPDAKGAECHVFYHDDMVTKRYSSIEGAKIAHDGQTQAAELGIAPPVLSPVRKHENKWEYDSARAVTPHTDQSLKARLNKFLSGNEGKALKKKLMSIGYGRDLKPLNLGIWDGKVVAIDFGQKSRKLYIKERIFPKRTNKNGRKTRRFLQG